MTVPPARKRLIGVFDSGVGGLTVVRRIWEMLPNEPVLFVADQAHVPYGGRPLSEVAGFARGISLSLIRDAGATAVVMACNISTATALETVEKANAEIGVLGMIAPGANGALRGAATPAIGVLATQGTVSTGAYTQTIRSLSPHTTVIEVACPDFVPLIEAELTESDEAMDAAHRYLAPIIRAGADVVILGCTHYPFLLSSLRKSAPNILFIDPAEQAVCELAQGIESRDPGSDYGSRPVHELYTTGDPEVFAKQVSFFLPKSTPPYIIKRAQWRGDHLSLTP